MKTKTTTSKWIYECNIHVITCIHYDIIDQWVKKKEEKKIRKSKIPCYAASFTEIFIYDCIYEYERRRMDINVGDRESMRKDILSFIKNIKKKTVFTRWWDKPRENGPKLIDHPIRRRESSHLYRERERKTFQMAMDTV